MRIIPGVVWTRQVTKWPGLLPTAFCQKGNRVRQRQCATWTSSAWPHLCVYGCSLPHLFGRGSLDDRHTQTRAADSGRCHTWTLLWSSSLRKHAAVPCTDTSMRNACSSQHISLFPLCHMDFLETSPNSNYTCMTPTFTSPHFNTMILNVNDWCMATRTHYWLCPGGMALYCAEKPPPAMLPSEWKVTHTVLLFVLTVGGATLPQNLQEGRTDLWMIISFYFLFSLIVHIWSWWSVESELCPVDSYKDMWLSYVTSLVFHFVATFQECK